jgi:enoyl-[acyl-carrier protein] reductase III
MKDNSLKGKVALITGGSRGIGRAITMKLAAQGADVIINYLRQRSAAEATAQEAGEKGVKAHIIKANIGDPDKIDAMFKEVEASFGRLDILINNAASGVARSAMELDARSWDWTIDINARAVLLCSQRAARLMPSGGKIANISSLGSRLVLPLYAAVGVSKAAVEALTRYLAVELAPRGIAVNGVAASAVRTEALKLYAQGLGAEQKRWQTTPVGRMVEPEDIANVVSFLCSEDATMIRGQIIVVDGGRSLTPAGYTVNQNEPGG